MLPLTDQQREIIRTAIVQQLAQFFVPYYSPAAMADQIIRNIETNWPKYVILPDEGPHFMCTCIGPEPTDREEHALRHARYDAQGNRKKNPDGSWYWGV